MLMLTALPKHSCVAISSLNILLKFSENNKYGPGNILPQN